jgi:large subunit ribosomal protein L10
MPTEKKAKIIDSLETTFAKSKAGVMTDYRGLKSSELVALRRKLKEAGLEFRIVKNTLAKIASAKAGKDKLAPAFQGPMAIAFGYDDIVKPARVVTEYITMSKLNMPIKGGFMGNQFLTLQEVKYLATLPSREILLAKVMSGMQSPMYAFMYQLEAPLTGLMTILQKRIKQLES